MARGLQSTNSSSGGNWTSDATGTGGGDFTDISLLGVGLLFAVLLAGTCFIVVQYRERNRRKDMSCPECGLVMDDGEEQVDHKGSRECLARRALEGRAGRSLLGTQEWIEAAGRLGIRSRGYNVPAAVSRGREGRKEGEEERVALIGMQSELEGDRQATAAGTGLVASTAILTGNDHQQQLQQHSLDIPMHPSIHNDTHNSRRVRRRRNAGEGADDDDDSGIDENAASAGAATVPHSSAMARGHGRAAAATSTEGIYADVTD